MHRVHKQGDLRCVNNSQDTSLLEEENVTEEALINNAGRKARQDPSQYNSQEVSSEQLLEDENYSDNGISLEENISFSSGNSENTVQGISRQNASIHSGDMSSKSDNETHEHNISCKMCDDPAETAHCVKCGKTACPMH